MSGNRFRCINQWYYSGFESVSTTNDVADEIISQPDKHLLSQSSLFAAQGGFSTVGLALGATAVGTLLVFAAAPRTAAHFRNGQLGFYEWATLGGSAGFAYWSGNWAGQRTFGDA